MVDIQWKSPPADYAVGSNAVHIWRSTFQQNLSAKMRFVASLSKGETERAKRFVRESDRDRFIFSHGLLRSVLAAYVGCEPQQLVFETNQYGKPFLISPDISIGLQFNLSHSHDLALIAVATETEVGVDVEYMRMVADARQIANRFFSLEESRVLNSLPPENFDEGFISCWVSKEAFVKGIGRGLSYPLNSFSVCFNGHPRVSVCSKDITCWDVLSLSVGHYYFAAVAIQQFINEVCFFEY